MLVTEANSIINPQFEAYSEASSEQSPRLVKAARRSSGRRSVNVIPFGLPQTNETPARPAVRSDWQAIAELLDRVAPNWSHSIRAISEVGDKVVVTAAITIDGITREGLGLGDGPTEAGIRKAEHEALKNAAGKFSVARRRAQRRETPKQRAAESNSIPANPLAKSIGELATPKQISMIRAICRESMRDVNTELETALKIGCRVEEISRRAASSFIDYLKRLQEVDEIPIVRRAY